MCYIYLLCILFLLIFFLDSFCLQPDPSLRFTRENLIDGNKAGRLTVQLKLVTSKVKQGQLWRPFTSLLLHAGVPHIAFNCLSLLVVGQLAARSLSPGRMLLCFLLSGWLSAITMMVLTGIEDGVGASPGIYGLLGACLAARLKMVSLPAPAPFALLVVLAMLVSNLLVDRYTKLEHLTGTVYGFLLGLVL